MPRLPLILCVVALLGSLASAVLYFRIGNSKQVLELRLADAASRASKLDADLAEANEHRGTLKAKVGDLSTELEGTRDKLSESRTRAEALDRDLAATRVRAEQSNRELVSARERADQLDSDLVATKAVLSVYDLTAQALAGEVAALRTDLADSRSSNASPEAVLGYKNTIAELEQQLVAARNGGAMAMAASAPTAVFTSRAGRATVLTVGPESAFVVLNFGSVRGAELGQKLEVSQGTLQVATVLISDVRANFSVAQVLPDTVRGVLQKGDSALLIR